MRIYAFSDFEGMKYDQKIEDPKFRLVELERTIHYFNLKLISNKDTMMNIQVKAFYSNLSVSIFEQCKKIIDSENMGGFVYETDGLIFTPIDKSVGSTKLGVLEKQGYDGWINQCNCCKMTEEEHLLNRRTDFKVIRL